MMPVRLSVHLSVTEMHWRIIANLGFKLRSTLPRIVAVVLLVGAMLLAVLLACESSRAMLASARLSCYSFILQCTVCITCNIYTSFADRALTSLDHTRVEHFAIEFVTRL